MSRDYKPKNPPATKSRGGGNLLIGIFIGVLLGLGIAVGVAWYMNNNKSPFVTKNANKSDKNLPALNEPGAVAAPNTAVPPQAGANTQAPGTALPPPVGQLTESKPRLDFYRILPGTEEPVTPAQIKQAESSPGSVESNKVKFYLQAGSFQNAGDADNLKARLALINVEATVLTADLGDKGVWNRVMIGPYAKIEDTTQLRRTLAQNGIEATMIKIKDTPH